MEEKIIVIGDSHSSFFGGREFSQCIPFVDSANHMIGIDSCGDLIENFTTFHLGSALACEPPTTEVEGF